MKSRNRGQAEAWTPNESDKSFWKTSQSQWVEGPEANVGSSSFSLRLPMKQTMCSTFVGLLLCLSVHAGDVKDTLRFNLTYVPSVAAPPKIDGVVDKREWY